MISFFIGLAIGAFIGMMIMCLLQVSNDIDREYEEQSKTNDGREN